jgi:hypothetical protein
MEGQPQKKSYDFLNDFVFFPPKKPYDFLNDFVIFAPLTLTSRQNNHMISGMTSLIFVPRLHKQKLYDFRGGQKKRSHSGNCMIVLAGS